MKKEKKISKEKKQLQKCVKSKRNIFFICFNVLLLIIALSTIALSVVDKCCGFIPWPADYENAVGVAIQTTTAIVSVIVSVIGVAISLQNEEFYGVKTTKLYALRSPKHYSIQTIISIAVTLCILSLIFYMTELTLPSLAALVLVVLFLLYVIRTEIPIIAKKEKAIQQILKDNLIVCYCEKQEVSKDLKDAIKYLLYHKNLKETYRIFKDKKDEKYNRYLLFMLLEIQQHFAAELKDNYDEDTQRIIGSVLMENVLDVMFHHIDIPDKTYTDIYENKHLLTRVLFHVYRLPTAHEKLQTCISQMIHHLSFSTETTQMEDRLVASVLITFIGETVKKNDFTVIKTFRRELSSCSWCLNHASMELDVFATLSLYLYCLCYSDSDVPDELKENVRSFINEGDIIEENTKIISWKTLFNETATEFHVDYHNFLSLVLTHSHNLEYWLNGLNVKSVVLEKGYITAWYLTHLFNRKTFDCFDYWSLLKENDELKHHLKSFANSCFDENKQFVPSENMIQIATFYGTTAEPFGFFRIVENRHHAFYDFVNQIKLDELKTETELAIEIDRSAFSQKIYETLEADIRNEWGYDPCLKITNSTRYFSFFLELFPDAKNFEDAIAKSCSRNLLADIQKSTLKTTLYNDDHFETNINSLLHKKLKYISTYTKNLIPDYIHNEALKQLFANVCNSLHEFKSQLLGPHTLITDNGFKFNCTIEKVEFRSLSEEERDRQISKYQRADGQYVFRGAFVPREVIVDIIKEKFIILTIAFRHQIVSSEDSIFELNPHSSKSEE